MSSNSSRNSPSAIATSTPTVAAAHRESQSNWASRSAVENDAVLRTAFRTVLEASKALPPAERLIMYDACDDDVPEKTLGPFSRKRLDPRRNTKPKKPDEQKYVCTPFNPAAFNFSKIANPGERLISFSFESGGYNLLTNKFPLFPKHMLLVATELVPQVLTIEHLHAVTSLIKESNFCAYFNSWGASASVNHFHCHVIDESPPITALQLERGPDVGGAPTSRPRGYPGCCYVFDVVDVDAVHKAIVAMQEDNQPHNLLFTPAHVYVWPKPHERDPRGFEMYPETVGGPELIGSFTVYTDADFAKICADDADRLVAMNTAPLPFRLLRPRDDAHVPSRAVEAGEGHALLGPDGEAVAGAAAAERTAAVVVQAEAVSAALDDVAADVDILADLLAKASDDSLGIAALLQAAEVSPPARRNSCPLPPAALRVLRLGGFDDAAYDAQALPPPEPLFSSKSFDAAFPASFSVVEEGLPRGGRVGHSTSYDQGFPSGSLMLPNLVRPRAPRAAASWSGRRRNAGGGI